MRVNISLSRADLCLRWVFVLRGSRQLTALSPVLNLPANMYLPSLIPYVPTLYPGDSVILKIFGLFSHIVCSLRNSDWFTFFRAKFLAPSFKVLSRDAFFNAADAIATDTRDEGQKSLHSQESYFIHTAVSTELLYRSVWGSGHSVPLTHQKCPVYPGTGSDEAPECTVSSSWFSILKFIFK